MNEIDEIKNIWQKHKTGGNFMSAEEFIKKNLKDDLSFLVKSQKKLVTTKGLGLSFGLILMLGSLYYSTLPILTKCYFILFALISVLFFVFYASHKFKMEDNNYLLPIKDFIDLALKRLQFEKKFVMVYLPLYFIVPLLLINALMLDVDKNLNFSKILLYHSAIIIFFTFILFMLRNARITRFEKQFTPLIEKLEKIKRENGNE
jgi:hypothetical protein